MGFVVTFSCVHYMCFLEGFQAQWPAPWRCPIPTLFFSALDGGFAVSHGPAPHVLLKWLCCGLCCDVVACNYIFFLKAAKRNGKNMEVPDSHAFFLGIRWGFAVSHGPAVHVLLKWLCCDVVLRALYMFFLKESKRNLQQRNGQHRGGW